MKPTTLITRRHAIIGGAAGLGGLLLRGLGKDLPPSYGNLLRMSDTLTYAAHRTLLPGQALVREYREADVTSFPATGTTNPAEITKAPLSGEYRRFQSTRFADWRLLVEGRVAAPTSFSLADLKAMSARTQITRHTCEEGWSAIGQWTGVPLSLVLNAAGILPSARFVVVQSFDDWTDSIDLLDAFHPQTILAYGMNGQDLPLAHGAPLRLRVERQMGYKSMKYLHRIIVSDTFEDGGDKGNIQNGWAWYTGI